MLAYAFEVTEVLHAFSLLRARLHLGKCSWLKTPFMASSAASNFAGICALDQYPDVSPDRQSEAGGVVHQL